MPGFGYGTLRRRRRKWAHSPIAPSRLAGGGRGGGAFLPDLFGGTARQWVEMAFGADLTADPDTWSWTDVTTSFLWDQGVNTTIGRPPESTRITPATMAGTIRNDQPNGGDWTVGNALSPRWPNVRENTPVRARLDVGNGSTVRFYGYAVSFKPDTLAVNDAGDRISVVRFKAAGVARRLFQGTSAPQSPMWRSHMLAHRYPTSSNFSGGGEYLDSGAGYHSLPSRYWPLEDSYGALQGTDVLDAAYSLRTASAASLPDFSSGTIGVGSKPLTVFKTGASLTASFPTVPLGASQVPSTTTTGLRLQFLMRLTQEAFDTIDAGAVNVEIVRVETAGTAARYSVWFEPVGGLSISMHAYDSAGVDLGSTPLFLDTALIETDVMISVELNQNGANTECDLVYTGLSTNPASGLPVGNAVSYTLDVAGRTIVGVNRVTFAPGAALAGVIIGHAAVYNGGEGTFPNLNNRACRGRAGDTAETRMRRLSIENDVDLEIVGTADLVMGVQGIGGYLDLMAEPERVDGGVLLDGLGPGLTYITRTHAYSNPASLTLDMSEGQVLTPIVAEHDDLGRINSFTASNPAGGEQTFTKETGDLGTDEVGVYDSSGLYPVALDSTLYDESAWRVHLGTVPGLRYPSASFQLAKPGTSAVAQQWLDTRPYGRLDILALEPNTVEPDKRFLLRYWTERWNSRLWSVTTALSPYAPWEIAVLAADVGDDSDFLFRLSGGYSTLTAGVAAGATSLTVATSSGPVWTTVADDIDGLHIDVDGLRIAVTNITGATSPQTFTVDGSTVLKALSAGASVDVWRPPALGL